MPALFAVLLLLLLAGQLVSVLWVGPYSVDQIAQVDASVRELEQRYADLLHRVESQQNMNTRLEPDSLDFDLLERLVRANLALSLTDELMVVLPSKNRDEPAADPETNRNVVEEATPSLVGGLDSVRKTP